MSQELLTKKTNGMKNGIVRKEGYTRYKIAYSRPMVGKQRLDSGKVFFIHEYPEKLVFTYFKYKKPLAGSNQFSTTSYKKKIFKKTKNGFRIFQVSIDGNEKKIRDVSCRAKLLDDLAYFKKTGAAHKRIDVIFNRFRKKFGYKRIKLDESVNSVNSFNREILKMCYPALRDVPERCWNTLNTPVSRGFIRPSLKEAVKFCFGYDNSRLLHLVNENLKKNSNFQSFKIGFLLKGLLPVDYMYKIFEYNPTFNSHQQSELKQLRNLLKKYNSQRIFKLMSENKFDVDYFFSDAARQYDMYKDKIILPEKPKNIIELHDNISTQYRKVKNADFEIDAGKHAELNGQTFDKFEVVIPKSKYELHDWGNMMHNCIASYALSMKNKETLLIGIKKNNELAYNIEIRNRKIMQFVGKRNSSPEESDKNTVLEFLAKNELIFPLTKTLESDIVAA